MSAEVEPGTLGDRARAHWAILTLSWRACRWRAVVVAILMVVGMLAAPVFSLAVAAFTDGVVLGDTADARSAVWIVFGLIVVGDLAARTLSFPLRMQLREMTVHQVDLELMRLTVGIPGIDHLERPVFADRVEALRAHRGRLAASFDLATGNLGLLVSAGASLSILAHIDPVLLAVPVCGLPSVYLSNRTARRSERVHEATIGFSRLFQHLFRLATTPAAAKELRVFGADRTVRDRHTEAAIVWEQATARAGLHNTAENLLGHLGFATGFAAAIGIILVAAAHGEVSAGEVAAAVTLAATLQAQVLALAQMTSNLRQSTESARRFAWLVRHAEQSHRATTAADRVPAPDRIADGIAFHDVGFRYPDTDTDVLTGIDLHIPAGTIVAIVGDNGAGKTTLVKLLTRMYQPTAGRITVDGVDLARITPDDWRTKISAGFQDYARFQFVAHRSVGVGSLPHLDDQETARAGLDRAAATDVVDTMPDGLDTQLGKAFADGHELSGGQWQKVALGRAMMRPHPLLLVLDEPTAALDAEAEHALFDRYAAAARAAGAETGAITLLVSHRFSTVRAADLIVVVDGNAIAEVGSHDQLIATGGIYAELYELQASSYR